MKIIEVLGGWGFLFLGVLICMGVFVLAYPVLDSGINDRFDEDKIPVYTYNFTKNVTGSISGDLVFSIENIISSNSLHNGFSVEDYYWININSSSGVMSINSSRDNETGRFNVSVHVIDGTNQGTTVASFFTVNATNDAPYFLNLNSSYDFPQAEGGSYVINAFDEEEDYPLFFNLTFINNCTHASWSSSSDGANCSIFNLSGTTETSTNFYFDNPLFEDVGTYWANFSVSDFNGTCPHEYCDASVYEENKSSGFFVLQFNVYSSLTINVSDCVGGNVFEGEVYNCTINVTSRGETDELNFSSLSNLTSRDYVGNKSWFYGEGTHNASDFFYSLPISVIPQKKQVGNWSVGFTVDDGSNSKTSWFYFFVNITESDVFLSPISSPISIYDDAVIYVNGTDEDLLVQDYSVKREDLTFSTNWSSSYIGVVEPTEDHTKNYEVASLLIDHDSFLNDYGEGNYSVNVSVVDKVGNLDWQDFIVEVLNESAPVWNLSLPDPVVLNLTEDVSFFYNVSVNVSDPGENVVFYYEDLSGDLCSFDSGNFNSSGIINFIPTDCDDGVHNFTFIAGNGKLNSTWNFFLNVSNVADLPSISDFTGDNGTQINLNEGSSFVLPEGVVGNFSLVFSDDDFLIPDSQVSYYDEAININITFTNSTGANFSFFNFSFLDEGFPLSNNARYSASFMPTVGDAGNYVVYMNATDSFGSSVDRTWFLNITESLDPPVLDNVSNYSLTINDFLNFTLNATDDEDDYGGLDLNYSVVSLDVGAPNLSVSGNSVYFDMGSNESFSGVWGYNASVVDNDSMIDWQIFYLFVYGNSSLISPATNSVFNLTENVSGILNFSINHSVGDNLTYEFWIDNVSCWIENGTDLNCSYGNFSFRGNDSGYGNGSFLGWEFTPNFRDETYGVLKNLTVMTYPSSGELNFSQKMLVASNFSFKLNISHSNAPVVFYSVLGMESSSTTNLQDIYYDLSEYFSDADIEDPYYSQNLSFVILTDSASNIDANGHRLPANFSQGNWDLYFDTGYTAKEFSEVVNVSVFDLDPDNNNITLTGDSSNNFELTFTIPQVKTTTSSGGGGGSSSAKIKFYSLRIIVPDDIIISDENYIEVPFGLENSGTIDLAGINLSSQVLYNNEFVDDVKVDLGIGYLASLKSGERKNYTMKIYADTGRSGKYKATVFANITSPKFFDWADFFIDLRRTNESEAKEVLIFTEKIIADNPECLELTEVFRRAQEAYDKGDNGLAVRLADEVSAACEDAISANEQIRYKVEGFVEENFYYISFLTLVVFFSGFILYVYRRIKFNKSVEDEYIR